MDNTIEEIYLKRCSKCGIISLKSVFLKDKHRKDGLHPQSISCRKKYCDKKQEKLKTFI